MIGRQTSYYNDQTDQKISVDSSWAAQHRKQLRARKPGRCTLARRQLKAIFNRRKYYHSIMGLTWVEIFFVFVRLILEVESLRVLPGPVLNSLTNTQIALSSISLFILTYFVLEQPFKWWAFGNRKCCRSLLLVIDAMVCFACFALNIYTLVMLCKRTGLGLASAKMIDLCGSTHYTRQPDTQGTFVLASGIIIVYRLWCISPYISKCVQKAVSAAKQQVASLTYALEESEHRINQLEGNVPDRNVPTLRLSSQESPARQGPRRGSYTDGNARVSNTTDSSQRGNPRPFVRPQRA